MALFSKKVLFLSIFVLAGAYLVAKYHVPVFLFLQDYCPWLMAYHTPSKDGGSATPDQLGGRIIRRSELAAHGPNSKKIYLAIVGQVFDVTEGKKHYGKDGGYNFFSGTDGTRGFMTGDFTPEGLIEDISDFTPHQCAEMKGWVDFYHGKYKFLGRLVGNFYDKDGNPTAALDTYTKCVAAGQQRQQEIEQDRIKYPPCNSRWSKSEGGYISCAPGSGGVDRDWGGVPRQYYRPGESDHRCACIRTSGLSGDGIDTGNRGDLDNPHFKVYEGCDSMAVECKLS